VPDCIRNGSEKYSVPYLISLGQRIMERFCEHGNESSDYAIGRDFFFLTNKQEEQTPWS
jgi:hypothetical protein